MFWQKEGHCVYSGPPILLRQSLIECNIECNENQIPIEVLIKLSSEVIHDINANKLYIKTEEKIQKSFELINDLNDLEIIELGLKASTKVINLFDFWYLLIRFFHRNYVSNFKTFAKQIIIYLMIVIIGLKLLEPRTYQSDGCIQLNTVPNKTCGEQRRDITDTSNNLNVTGILMVFSAIIILLSFCITYANDMKIFVSEHKNRKFYRIFYINILKKKNLLFHIIHMKTELG